MTNLSAPIVSRRIQTRTVKSCEWKTTTNILAYGVRVGLRTNKEEVLDYFSDYLPPLWKVSTATSVDRVFSLRIGKARHVLFEGSDMTIESRSLRTVLEDFRVRVKAYVAEMARRRVFIHAGAVGWQGRAIIIPGRTMSGKTSLVSELVRAGATYYSDEYAVMDMRGRVHPYPQPLAIRKPGSIFQRNRSVEELGGIAGDRPLPVGLVIVTRYQDNARWRPAQLTSGQGLLELLNSTVPARRKPQIVLPILKRAVGEGIVLKGARGGARETADLILRRLEA
jgi:hypothetical protein